MLSVIEFNSTDVPDNLNGKKKQEFSVWTNEDNDNQSINLMMTDFISVWEGIINVTNQPESISDTWEIYQTKLLNAFSNNNTNFIYNYSPINKSNNNYDITITILENFQGNKKVWLNKSKLFRKDESNSVLNFHIAISKQLKIQNEKYNNVIQVNQNQSKDIENLRNVLQRNTIEKEEQTKKMFTKLALLLNSKKTYFKNNIDNHDNDDHSSRNSNKSDDDDDDDNDDDDDANNKKKQENSKKRKIQANTQINKKNSKNKSSSSSSSMINNLKIVHDSKLSSLLASQTQSQDSSQLQSQNKTIVSGPQGGAFSRFLQDDDDDDDCFDFE